MQDEIKTLLASLQLEDITQQEQLKVFTQLKIHSRTLAGSIILFEENALEVLSPYTFDSSIKNECDLEALRCFANVLLLVPRSRQRFVDQGYAVLAVSELRDADIEHEFLFSRLLFLLTYETDCDFAGLVEDRQLGFIICQNLERHASTSERRVPPGSKNRPQMETMALVETLKLLFNILHSHPDLEKSFNPSIPSILKLTCREEVQKNTPLDPVIGYLVNALMNLDLSASQEDLFSTREPQRFTEKLIDLLRAVITRYPLQEQDTRSPPLLSLIGKTFSIAPQQVKSTLKSTLLPSDAERDIPLGRSETLSGKLLRLSTTARTSELRDIIQSLLYDLSDNDPKTFVHNVGYGYASGFFVNHNIPTAGIFPQDRNRPVHNDESRRVIELGDSEEPEEHTSNDETPSVNFVTGQYLASEPQREEEEQMTEEEKLREAERLFVLFERLKATGVVDVENPVETAARSGQLG